MRPLFERGLTAGRWRFTLSVIAAVSYVLLAERLVIGLQTGGQGALPLALVLVVAVAALLVIAGDVRLGTLPRGSWGGRVFGPFVALAIVLPMLSPLRGGFELRHSAAAMEGVLPILFGVLGASWARAGGRAVAGLRAGVATLVLIELAMAVGQLLALGGHQGPLVSMIAAWDRSASELNPAAPMVVGRSVGTFTNPNTLGFFSVLAFWCCLYLLRGGHRLIGAVATLLTLILSQSRGSYAALVASVVLLTPVHVAHWGRGGGRIRTRSLLKGIAVAIMFGLALIPRLGQVGEAGVLGPLRKPLERVISILDSGGLAVADDRNFAARLGAWNVALDVLNREPLGTLGPPQVRLRKSIDNEFIRVALQGGALFLGALLLMMASSVAGVVTTPGPRSLLAVLMLCVAVNGVSATLLLTPPMALCWMVVGYVVGSPANGKATQSRQGGGFTGENASEGACSPAEASVG